MKMGHVVGTRKVSRESQRWYDAIQEEHLRKIEAELAPQAAATATMPEHVQVVPVALAEGDYKDWEVSVDGETYLVIDDAGDWELRQLRHNGWQNDWQLIGVGTEV